MPHRYKELSLGQLRAFCECIRHRSFSAAARALQQSHPAVWQQVRALEQSLSVSLVHRQGRELVATEDGRVLLDLASTIVGEVDSLRETFEQRRHEVTRTLVLIGTPVVLGETLTEAIAEFCRNQPQVRLTLLSHAGVQTLELLLTGEADLAVLPVSAVASRTRQFLVPEPLTERVVAMVMPQGHALARKRRLTVADLVKHPLILPSDRGSDLRRRIDDVFREAGLLEKVQVRLEVGLSQAARRLVGLGLGLALVPHLPAGLLAPGLISRPLPELFPTEPVQIYWRRGVRPRPQAREFADFLRVLMAR
jgi:DNA-binding transcriptional LysR family regulator